MRLSPSKRSVPSSKPASSVVPKKNNPVMDKMESRAQERERRRLEILKKKEEKAKLEEEKQKELAISVKYYSSSLYYWWFLCWLWKYRNKRMLNARSEKKHSNLSREENRKKNVESKLKKLGNKLLRIWWKQSYSISLSRFLGYLIMDLKS